MSRYLDTAMSIARLSREPFAWGHMDCYVFTSEVVKDVSGMDFTSLFKGRYDSLRAAYAMIDASGGSLYTMTREVLGDHSEIDECDDGDPVIVENERIFRHHALGVLFDGCAVLKTPRMVRSVPLDLVTTAWHLEA